MGLDWREDGTNEDHLGWRSRVRHRIFPYLEKVYGRGVKRVLARTAEIFAGEKEYWEREMGRIPQRPDVRDWRKKPVAWQRRAIRRWLMDRGVSGPSWGEIERVRKLIRGGATQRAQLRQGAGVGRSCNKLFWIKKMGLIAKAKAKC
jgi:tRNA(Ile)-lysidine synthase TilS/MesJ